MGFIDIVNVIVFLCACDHRLPWQLCLLLDGAAENRFLVLVFPAIQGLLGVRWAGGRGVESGSAVAAMEAIVGRSGAGQGRRPQGGRPDSRLRMARGSSGTVPAAVVVVGRGAAQWPQWQWHPWRGGPAAADGGGRHGRLGLVGGPSEVNGGVGSRAVRGAVAGADCPVIIFDVCVPQNVGVVAGAARSSFSRHTAGLAQPVDGRSLATICSFSARLRLTTRAWQRQVGCGRRPRRRRTAAMASPIVPPLYPSGRCWRASRVAGGGGSAAAADAAVTPATSPVAAFAPVDESAAVAAAMAVAGPLTASPARSSAAAGQLRRGQRSRPNGPTFPTEPANVPDRPDDVDGANESKQSCDNDFSHGLWSSQTVTVTMSSVACAPAVGERRG